MYDTERPTPPGKGALALHDVAGRLRGGTEPCDGRMTGFSFRPGRVGEYAETTGAVLGGRAGRDVAREGGRRP